MTHAAHRSTETVLHSKDVLDPRVLVCEGALSAVWDGTNWHRLSAAEAEALTGVLVPVRGTNIRHGIVMRARQALDFWG